MTVTEGLAQHAGRYELSHLRVAGGRGHPHHPGGGRRVRAAGAAVLRRQGLDRHAAPGDQGVPAGPAAVPGDACRHRAQLRRGAGCSATSSSPSPGCAWWSPRCRTTSTRAGWSRPSRRATRCRPSRCCAPSGRTSSTPPSAVPAATKRRPAPRSACSPSATSSANGTRRRSGPSCGTSTTAATTRASTSGCSRCPTGPNSTSGPTSAPRRSSCPRSTTHTSGRSSNATECSGRAQVPAAAQGREDHREDRAVPHRRRRHLHRLRRIVGGHGSEVIAETAVSRLTERGATRADDRISEAGMEDRKREGYF